MKDLYLSVHLLNLSSDGSTLRCFPPQKKRQTATSPARPPPSCWGTFQPVECFPSGSRLFTPSTGHPRGVRYLLLNVHVVNPLDCLSGLLVVLWWVHGGQTSEVTACFFSCTCRRLCGCVPVS